MQTNFAACHPDWIQLEKGSYLTMHKLSHIYDTTVSGDCLFNIRSWELWKTFSVSWCWALAPLLSAWFFFWFADFMPATNPYSKEFSTIPWLIFYVLDWILSSFRNQWPLCAGSNSDPSSFWLSWKVPAALFKSPFTSLDLVWLILCEYLKCCCSNALPLLCFIIIND